MSSGPLTPAANDLSVSILTQLFGNGWQNLFTAGGDQVTTLLGTMFQSFNIALMGFVASLLVYQTTLMSLQTAHEGVTLGKRYHSIYAPIRAPLSIFMLTPLPLLKGLSVLQALGMLAVSASIGMTDTVWTSFTDYLPKHTDTIVLDQTMAGPRSSLVNAALVNVTMADAVHAINPSITPTWNWSCSPDITNLNHGTCTYQVDSGNGSNASYGSFTVGCGQEVSGFGSTITTAMGSFLTWLVNKETLGAVPTPPDPTKTAECQARKNIVTSLMNDVQPAAAGIVQHGLKGDPMPADALNTALSNLNTNLTSIITSSNASVQSQFMQEVNDFSTKSSDYGWLSSIMYYPVLSSLISSAQSMIDKATPSINLASIDPHTSEFMFGVPPADLSPVIASLNAYTDTSPINAQSLKNVGGQAKLDGFMTQWLGGKLQSYADDMSQGGNLLAYMSAQGQQIITIGEMTVGAATTSTLAAVGIGAALGTAAEPGGGTIAGAAAGALAKSIINSLGSLAIMVGSALIVEGVIMAYVLPFLPTTVMLFAAIGWIILVVEMFVAIPLFAAALAFAEGEGLTPQQARHGLAVFGGILLRPILLTFGFVFAFFAFTFASKLLGLAFGVYLTVQSKAGIGPVDFTALMAILVGTATSLVYFIAKMITHLADHAPQWIGGSAGASLGTEHAAQGATQQTSGMAKAGAGAAVGWAGKSAMNAGNEGIKGGVGKKKELSQAASAKEQAEEKKANSDQSAQLNGFRDSAHQKQYQAALAAENLKQNHGEGPGGNPEHLADGPGNAVGKGGGGSAPASGNAPAGGSNQSIEDKKASFRSNGDLGAQPKGKE